MLITLKYLTLISFCFAGRGEADGSVGILKIP